MNNSVRYLIPLLLSLLIACTTGSKKEAEGFDETAFIPCCGEASPNNSTLTLNIAVNDTYCKQTACVCIHDVAAREYDEMVQLLKDEHNIDLKITYFVEPYDLEDTLKSKTFDGVICKPWTAIMLTKEHNLRFKRIVDVLDVDSKQWLTGVFMVPVDSPIQSMADINGKTLVMGQVDAYEKHHLALKLIKQNGVKPGRMYEKASCTECINELLDSKAEVAVVSDYVMTASCAVDMVAEDEFRIIGETERIPLTSLLLDMKKISKEDAIRLQEALLAISGDNMPESMLGNGFVKPAPWTPESLKIEN